MSNLFAKSYQNIPLTTLPDGQFLDAMAAGEHLTVVIYSPGTGAAPLLDRVMPVLLREGYRVLRAGGVGEAPLDLNGLIDQVVGPDRQDGTDRVEQFYNLLTSAEADETRLVLIVDEAHLLTAKALAYLDLLVSIENLTSLQLQLVLAGLPSLWEHLPDRGRLAAGNVVTRITLGSRDASVDMNLEFARLSAPLAVSDAPPLATQPACETATAGPAAEPANRESRPVSHLIAHPQAMAAFAGQRPKSRRSGRLAWAASMGIIVAGSGLAASQYFPNGLSQVGALSQVNAMPAPRITEASADPVVNVPRMVLASASPAAEATLADAGPANEGPTNEAPVASAPTGTSPADAAPDEASDANASAPDLSVGQAPSTDPAPTVPETESVAAPPTDTDAPKMADQPDLPKPVAVEQPPKPEAVPPETAAAAPPSVITASRDAATPAQRPSSAAMPSGVVAMLLDRGNALLATGDVSAARAMYERAALADSGPAAIALGMTYDPRFLAQIRVRGMEPDPKRAISWYQRASDLGSMEGRQLLTQLQTAGGNR
jgi:hypothetical protein